METIETGEFNLQPDKHKRKGNWKGKLAAALAGVIGASVIGPSIASLIPETVEAAASVKYANTEDLGEKRAGGTSSRVDDYTVVRSANQLEKAINTAIAEGWTKDQELVIYVDNSKEILYDDGSYEVNSKELNCFVMDRTIEIPAGVNIKLVAGKEDKVTFVRSSDFNNDEAMFKVNGTLTLTENITMTGDLTTKVADVAAGGAQSQVCDGGEAPGQVIKKEVDYVDIQKTNGILEIPNNNLNNSRIYNSEGKVLVGAADNEVGKTTYNNVEFFNAVFVDADSSLGGTAAKVTWSNEVKTNGNYSVNIIKNTNGWALALADDKLVVVPATSVTVTDDGTVKAKNVNNGSEVTNLKTHFAVSDNKLMVGQHGGETLTDATSILGFKQKVGPVYYEGNVCSDGSQPKTIPAHGTGKKYGDSESKVWENSGSNTFLKNHTGFFIRQEGGNLNIAGATFKDFNVVSGEGTYRKQPLGCAPIYVAGGTFTMTSGNIVNNTLGYTIDENKSGEEAQNLKQHVEKKPETHTAGAIMFMGGTDHNITGGFIAGNKADTGAIIVKTRNDYPLVENTSYDSYQGMRNWAANRTDNKQTKVTIDCDTTNTAGPVIAGNVGIHGSGAVYIWSVGDNDSAEVEFNAGTIKDNFAWYKGGAFTVCSEAEPIEHFSKDTKRTYAEAILNMNGGLIDNNTAVNRAGAIEVLSDDVHLKAGIIQNNNSRMLGGAIYVEGDFSNHLYTLYLPSVNLTNNNAWMETKADKEDNDYAYLKRKIVSENRAKENEDGTYTYDNPLGNVRNNNGVVVENDKRSWTKIPSGEKKWILSDTRTSDWKDFYAHSGIGGGLWLCALGGYASITHIDGEDVEGAGAQIRGNHGIKNASDTGQTPWDITALARDGGFTLNYKTESSTPEHSPYKYIDTDTYLEWNKMYSGEKSRYDLVNADPSAYSDNTEDGTKGILIQKNNARTGGGIAGNGTTVFGEGGKIYRHSIETTFEKSWEDGTEPKTSMFRCYIIKKEADGTETRMYIPGYQFILDGNADATTGGGGSVGEQALIRETAPWSAKINLPFGYNGTPTFIMKAKSTEGMNELFSTLRTNWNISLNGTEGTGEITQWNFGIEEIPSARYKNTIKGVEHLMLVKKVDSETDRDPNFGNDTAPVDFVRDRSERINFYTNIPEKNPSYREGLYLTIDFPKDTTNIDLMLYEGEYALFRATGEMVDSFTISADNAETDYRPVNLLEKPSEVKLEQTVNEIKLEGTTIPSVNEIVTRAYTESGNNLQMENKKRLKPAIEKYVNQKVDHDLSSVKESFTYDIIAKVPDQASEFTVNDTLVEWLKFTSTAAGDVSIKVLDNNDHFGDGTGTVKTGQVDGNNVINTALTNKLKEKADITILNGTLSVRVTDLELLKELTGKYIQITVGAEIDSDHYDEVLEKVSGDREETYSTAKGSYTLRNKFEPNQYTYRLYRISDINGNSEDGLTNSFSGDKKAGTYLTDEELKALGGVSGDAKVRRSVRLGVEGGYIGNFNENTATFENLPAGKYVVHVMNDKALDDTGGFSKSKAALNRCEVFEITGDQNDDIRWVSVAGNNQGDLPDAFKNDSPFMGADKQQDEPQVVTGSKANLTDTSDDPVHDGIGNRATLEVTYRRGGKSSLMSNTVTVEPKAETLEVEKYVNKKVDDDLAGFDSEFTYDIMAYVPNGASEVVIKDKLVSWLEFANTDATIDQIRVLNDNNHIGNGEGTVATGKDSNGNNVVSDVNLTGKYTVSKSGNTLSVKIDDKSTVTQLWGKWVQVTFNAKIKADAYSDVMSRLKEKDKYSDRAVVTLGYFDMNDEGGLYRIKDYDVNHDNNGVHYRLYRVWPDGSTGNFNLGYSQIFNNEQLSGSSIPEAAQNLFGIQNDTQIIKSKEIDKEVTSGYGGGFGRYNYDTTKGGAPGVFDYLPAGDYLLYAWEGDEESNFSPLRSEHFVITKENYNWVEVRKDTQATETEAAKAFGINGQEYPDYLVGNLSVREAPDNHDGIGNRAEYGVKYGTGGSGTMKTNVVTVEPPKEELSITKVWEGDTEPSDKVKNAFLNALSLKLDGGDDIPYPYSLVLGNTTGGNGNWTTPISISTKLPKFEHKQYSFEEKLDILQGSTDSEIADFFKYYNVSYSGSVNDSSHLKITDLVNNFDPDKFYYTIASDTFIKDDLFVEQHTNHANFKWVYEEGLLSQNVCSRTSNFENQEQFNALLNRLQSGDYVLLAQERVYNNTKEGRGGCNYEAIPGRSAKFHYEAPDFASQVKEQLTDEYGNSKLNKNVLVIEAGEDSKIVSARKLNDNWIYAKNGDSTTIQRVFGVSPIYVNDDYWGWTINKGSIEPDDEMPETANKFSQTKKSVRTIVDMKTMPGDTTYYYIHYNNGDFDYRRYDVIGANNFDQVTYSIYKMVDTPADTDKTLAEVIEDHKYRNGRAYDVEDKENYVLLKAGVSKADIESGEAFTTDGQFVIVAENNAEEPVYINLTRQYNDGALPNEGTIYNRQKLFKVVIRKTDMGGADLTGAQFKLTDDNNNEYELKEDDKNGAYFMSKTELKAGDYTLEEIKAPNGRDKLNGKITFKLTDDGEITNVSYKDPKDDGKVSIDPKVDANGIHNQINVKNKGDETSIKLTKNWTLDEGVELPDNLDEVKIYLYSDAKEANVFELYSDEPYEIKKEERWVLTINELPMYTYKSDGSIDRAIQYKVGEANVEGFYTQSISGTVQAPIDNAKAYYGYSEALKYTENHASCVISTPHTHTGKHYPYCGIGGGTYHYLQKSTNGSAPGLSAASIPAFCINYGMYDPNVINKTGNSYNPVKYEKVEIKDYNELEKYINVNHISYDDFSVTFGNEPIVDLYNRLKLIGYYGYGSDKKEFQDTYKLSDEQFRYITSAAIYEYTDWYGGIYTNKDEHLYCLEIPSKRYNTEGAELLFEEENIGWKMPDTPLPSGIGLREAFKEFMKLVNNNENFADVEHYKLYIYKPLSTASDGKPYQNLFGIEDVWNEITITNKNLPNLVFQKIGEKVDDEDAPIVHDNGDNTGEFKLVTGANDAEQAKSMAETGGIGSIASGEKNNALYTFKGVSPGTYWLVETKAPRYYSIGDPIEIFVKQEEVNGEKILKVTLPNSDRDDKWFTLNGNQTTSADFAFSYRDELLKVKLPDTGGIGTMWFYIIGAIAAGTAVTIIVARKKYKNKINKDVA